MRNWWCMMLPCWPGRYGKSTLKIRRSFARRWLEPTESWRLPERAKRQLSESCKARLEAKAKDKEGNAKEKNAEDSAKMGKSEVLKPSHPTFTKAIPVGHQPSGKCRQRCDKP
jgi:hypothetical protein